MTPNVDSASVVALIRATTDKHILPRYRRLEAHEIKSKSSPNDLVTIADLESEAALTPALMDLLPGSQVVGEEAVGRDPAVLDRLESDAPVWIIDPIDGTFNFTSASPLFAVIVALTIGGQACAGWIHDPIRGITVTAAAGSGAWLVDAQGGRQRLRRREPPEHHALRGSASGRYGERGRIRDLLERGGRLGPIQMLRSAGQEYLALAEGRLDYAVFSRTLPWDHAAGILIHREAGGVAGFIDGATPEQTPYSPRRRQGPLLTAPSRELWQEIRAIIVNPAP